MQIIVALVGLVVILAFVASSAFDAWRSHRYAVAATGREISNVANALAEQTAWSLEAVDLLLIDTARWYRTDIHQIPESSRNAALAARIAGVLPVREVTIMDAKGDQLYHSRMTSFPNHNIADRSYFIAQRDDPGAGLFISELLTTRNEGRAAVVLSRRIDDEAGHFAGIAIANVDLEDLNQFYQAVKMGPGSHVGLLRSDGTLLVRNPAAADKVGQRFPELVALHDGADTPIRNPINQQMDFVAVTPVRATPLRLVVTRDVEAALQPWRDETIRVAVRTLIVVSLGTFLLLLLLRQIKRVEASQRALRESEERYALAMEAANEGHFDWDMVSDRLYRSPRMMVLHGLGTEQLVSAGQDALRTVDIHTEDRARIDAAVRSHLAGRTPRFESEYRVRHPNGEWRWLLSRGRCDFDSAGRPSRFVGSAVDVTEQKQAELEKEALELQLRQSQKMEAVGTLAGGIAHDFNNVLGAILGYGELALEHASTNRDLRRYLDNVMHAAVRAKLLVERILGFSRSSLGNKVLFNVQTVVSETLELLDASLPVDIQLRRTLNAGDAAVLGDATYLHQVTMNLCTNALQAMTRGGVLDVQLERVTLTVARTPLRGALPPGEYVRLAVSDTGGGIPTELLERIFDPFFTTKNVGEGTGLGLSMVLRIVADLGGAIEVDSSVGAGTRFEVFLPVAGEAPAAGVEVAQELPVGHGETVMIVDDERHLVELAEEVVARLGYEPVGFDSSLAAAEAFRSTPDRFDVILTDEMMPGLTGTELASRARALRPSVPIILMSGRVEGSLHATAASVGIEEVLNKPLHAREIAEALARAVGIPA